MAYFEWADDMVIDNGVIDADHQQLGGFNRSSQHRVRRLIVDSHSALLQEFSTPTSYVACC